MSAMLFNSSNSPQYTVMGAGMLVGGHGEPRILQHSTSRLSWRRCVSSPSFSGPIPHSTIFISIFCRTASAPPAVSAWRSGWSMWGGVRPLAMRWMGMGCPAAYSACATLNITWEPMECPKNTVGLSSRGRIACTSSSMICCILSAGGSACLDPWPGYSNSHTSTSSGRCFTHWSRLEKLPQAYGKVNRRSLALGSGRCARRQAVEYFPCLTASTWTSESSLHLRLVLLGVSGSASPARDRPLADGEVGFLVFMGVTGGVCSPNVVDRILSASSGVQERTPGNGFCRKADQLAASHISAWCSSSDSNSESSDTPSSSNALARSSSSSKG
mmetsp:Transcript_21631/g.47516  ORF Transcript_21631/g.47516 Transcript_21631/m.47516 type:complete len:329 (-) Transcript_21631:405-1391(-)